MTPIERIKELRERTHVSIGICKEARHSIDALGELPDEEFFAKAIEWMRIKGTLRVQDLTERGTHNGAIVTYIHPGNLLGAMVQVDCETDFVAKSEDFLAFCRDVAMHVAAAKPKFVGLQDVDGGFRAQEMALLVLQMDADPKMAGKPPQMKEKILAGKIDKVLREVCLLDQPFVKDPTKNILSLLAELVLKTGENIKIARFMRFDVREVAPRL